MRRSTNPSDYQHTPHVAAVMAKQFCDGFEIAPHWHKRHQLIWATTGVMEIEAAEGTWVVPTNRALWVPATHVHSLRMAGAVEMRSLYLEPGTGRTPSQVKLVAVSALLAALLSEAASWSLDRNDRRADLVTELILDELTELADKPIQLPDPVDERLRSVCDALRRSPGSRWTLEQWADTVGVSARTLARLFAQETKMRFHDWRHQARLTHALVKLANGHSVASIADELGYRSPSAFTHAFRRTLGFTPAHYLARQHSDRDF
jgi:AraC-like DNA-binding protein